MDVIELTRELVRIPSITNDEGLVGALIADRLSAAGWHVTRQEIPPEGNARPASPRYNVLAQSEASGAPRVVFTTHIDTVPPFLPLREDETYLYGRGTCDAKGIFAAQWLAAERLRAAGEKGIALLAIVGEETDSWGAKQAHELLPKASFVVDGEPTDLIPASGAKGILALNLSVSGQAAHSAYPELGHSAVHDLLPGLTRLLGEKLPFDPIYGETTVNVGLLQGGVAPNVIAPGASATVLIRLGAPSDLVLAEVKRILGPLIAVEITSRAEPHPIRVPAGQEGLVVRFGSDVPYLKRIGTPLLVGPGSIHDAHTAGEKVKKADLLAAVDLYAAIGRELLAESAREAP